MSEERTLFGKKNPVETAPSSEYLQPAHEAQTDSLASGIAEDTVGQQSGGQDDTPSSRFNWKSDPGTDPFGRGDAPASMDFSWNIPPLNPAADEQVMVEPVRQGPYALPDDHDEDESTDYETITPPHAVEEAEQLSAIQSGEAEPGDYVPPTQESEPTPPLVQMTDEEPSEPLTPFVSPYQDASEEDIEASEPVKHESPAERQAERDPFFGDDAATQVAYDVAVEPTLMPLDEQPESQGADADALLTEELGVDDEPPLDPVVLQHEISELSAAHLIWLQSDGREGRRANFRGGKYKLGNFNGLNLSEANFRGASLGGSQFRGTQLAGADFAEADLQRADFAGATMNGASLQRAEVGYADFTGANLTGANLSYVTGEGARFNQAQMGEAVMRDAQLVNALLIGANLQGSNLRGASFNGALLEGADLTGAECRQTNFERARFDGAILAQAQFRQATLAGVDMNATDFSQAVDIAPDFHAASVQNERDKLQDEFAQLDRLRSELEIRERKLHEDRNVFLRQSQHTGTAAAATGQAPVADSGNLLVKINRQARWFAITTILWFFMVVGVIAISFSLLSEAAEQSLNTMEMGLLGAILLVPLLLFFTAMAKSYDIASSLKRYARGGTGKTGRI